MLTAEAWQETEALQHHSLGYFAVITHLLENAASLTCLSKE